MNLLQLKYLKITIIFLLIVWTVLIVLSLFWNIDLLNKNMFESAHIQLKTAYEKDVVYRSWNAGYHGVYVPVTDENQPNPYLSDFHDRDITTNQGKTLTLINPAYMNRQVYELENKYSDTHGHITSLRPIRPMNKPDDWEKLALERFEKGEQEVFEESLLNGSRYFRYMHPLFVEKRCLVCHAKQGYKEGDIRGGISISLPVDPLHNLNNRAVLRLSFIHLGLWIIGFSGLLFGYVLLKKRTMIIINYANELDTANKTKDRFFSIISHDLKNPFHTILGYINFFIEDYKELSDLEKANMLNTLKETTEETYRLLDNLLQWSQSQLNKLEVEKENFDLHSLLGASLAVVLPNALKKGIVIDNKTASGIVVNADKNMISTVMRNLLSNSIKFTPRGGEIGIVSEIKNNIIDISITDTGVGMSEASLNRLFNLNSIKSSEGTENEKGTGLGLIICKEFVEKNNGKIRVTSELGKGSKFTVSLPFVSK